MYLILSQTPLISQFFICTVVLADPGHARAARPPSLAARLTPAT